MGSVVGSVRESETWECEEDAGCGGDGGCGDECDGRWGSGGGEEQREPVVVIATAVAAAAIRIVSSLFIG